MKGILALFCLAGATSAFAADLPLYATASAGWQMGGYQSALSARPFAIYSRHRDTFAPSVGLGWKFNSRIAVEAAYTDFGDYEFDQEYGLSPFNPPGAIVVQVTSRLLIKEELKGLSLRVPFRWTLGPRLRLEVTPGVNRMELREHFFSRSIMVVVVAPNTPPGGPTFFDAPGFSRESTRWRPEGKAALHFAFNEKMSVHVGCLYTDVARKKLSVLSVGGRFDF